jgi:hypothetical protein
VPTVATPNIMQDPGFLYLAPTTTTFPSGVAAGSKFTDTPSVTFVEIGATQDGTRFKYAPQIEAVSVAEFLDPVLWRTVSREGSMAFNLADFTLNNLKRAMNGGAIATVGGAGATLVSEYTPPTLGAEVRLALMWESQDSTMRIFFYKTINVATVEAAFQKAPAYAVYPAEFRMEVDPSGFTFKVQTAGTARLGV